MTWPNVIVERERGGMCAWPGSKAYPHLSASPTTGGIVWREEHWAPADKSAWLPLPDGADWPVALDRSLRAPYLPQSSDPYL